MEGAVFERVDFRLQGFLGAGERRTDLIRQHVFGVGIAADCVALSYGDCHNKFHFHTPSARADRCHFLSNARSFSRSPNMPKGRIPAALMPISRCKSAVLHPSEQKMWRGYWD